MFTRTISRRELLRLAGLGFLGTLAACSSQTVRQTVQVEEEATTALEETPQIEKVAVTPTYGGRFTYDWSPHETVGIHSGGRVPRLIYERLVDLALDGSTPPNLAQEVKISPDCREFTFKLRKGVTWHDGEPFTARDVIHTLKFCLHSDFLHEIKGSLKLGAIKGARAFTMGEATKIEGATAPDDHTVAFELEKANSAWLVTTISQWNIQPEHIWKDIPPAQVAEAHAPFWFERQYQIGTGPFQYVEGEDEKFMRLARYDDYWGGKPFLDTILFKDFGWMDTTWLAFQKGEVSAMVIDGGKKTLARQMPNVRTAEHVVPSICYFLVNLRNDWLADVRVRQAFSHAIDRPAICQTMLYGDKEPWYSPIPQDKWLNEKMTAYKYDPEKAKSLLAEAEADAAWDPSRELLMLTSYGSRDMMAAFQSYLGAAGVKTTIKRLQSVQTVDAVKAGNYDLCYTMSPTGFDPSLLIASYTCEAPTALSFWQGTHANVCKRMYALFEQAMVVGDFDARKAPYDDIQKLWGKYLPAIILWRHKTTIAIYREFGGIDTDGLAYLSVWNVSYHKAHLWHKVG